MSEFTSPSRKTLIVGAVKAALYGLEARRISEVRRAGAGDWNADPELCEIRRVSAAVYAGQATQTRDMEILSMLAYTQQSMRLSHDEWNSCVQVMHATA